MTDQKKLRILFQLLELLEWILIQLVEKVLMKK